MELLLKDRAQDVLENISPALAQGRTVIIDRYILSNAAYQGALPGGDPGAILAANKAFPWPDLTIILEVEVFEGLCRIGRRGETEEAFENAPYLSKVKEIYDRLSLPGLARLSSQAPPDEVFEAISKLAESLFSKPPLHP
jgi:dTMP kinase